MRPNRERRIGVPHTRAPLAWVAVAVFGLGCFSCQVGEDDSGGLGADFRPGPSNLHRLTSYQYNQTVSDLFGAELTLPTELEIDPTLFGFQQIGASSATISQRGALLYEEAAFSIAAQVAGVAAKRTTLTGCTSPSLDCFRSFVTAFGRRVYRRPLIAAEVDGLIAITDTMSKAYANDLWKGLEFTIAAMLQSPHFLFRVELGEEDPANPSRLRYSNIEMASRLSYFLTNTTPDLELLDAADGGELVTTDGIRKAATRLLSSEKAKTFIQTFFADYFALEQLATTTKSPQLFGPRLSPTLMQSMRTEVERLVEDVIFVQRRPYTDLLRTQESFVNGDLAKVYDLPLTGSEFQRVQLPGPRVGILGTAGFLALNANYTATSPTHRGKWVRTHLLCEDIPPPTEEALQQTAELAKQNLTPRETVDYLLSQPSCRSCHLKMDPIGIGFERFDAIGALRSMEKGKEIDDAGDLDGQVFHGPQELANLIGNDPKTKLCAVRQLYRHAVGRHEELTEEPAVAALASRFDALGESFADLLVEVVLSDGFRYAAKPEN